MEQTIVVKGTPQENKPALIIIAAGISLLFAAVIVASVIFRFDWIDWDEMYDYKFIKFFVSKFLIDYNEALLNIIPGIAALIIGIIMKLRTEKCKITVTTDAVFGMTSRKEAVSIPLDQITAVSRCSFNGISITSIGRVSNFRCIENRDEVIKAISYLLANPQQSSAQSGSAASANGSEAEQLKRLKDLLDAGVLTQDEFDGKKKQILGL